MAPIFGYHMPNFTFPDVPPAGLFGRVVELAQAAEAAGFDMITVMDHVHQIVVHGAEDEPMLEAYTTLGAIAARTQRVRLGTLVTGVTYRNPAHLAKQVSTLDIISGGRAILGIGAAWNESEHAAYGFEFPPIGERMDRLDEALAICRAMFSEDRPTFAGAHYRVDRPFNVPRSIQPGGPRILVGGGGEKRTLRLVARYADYSHWFPTGLDDLRRKSEILDRYCEEIGRDPATVTRTIASPVVLVADEAAGRAMVELIPPERRSMIRPTTPARAAEILAEYVAAGFTGFTFANSTMKTPAAVALGGELISRMRP
jgi:F420-dependent oxidoreductase-like protein